LGIPYTTLNREDVALLGNILLAGSAVGIYNDIKEKAREFAKTGNRYIPDKNINSYYRKYMKIYSSVFDKVRDIFVDLENIPDYSL
jgi:sugar (pentulose or hexulose) kinase